VDPEAGQASGRPKATEPNFFPTFVAGTIEALPFYPDPCPHFLDGDESGGGCFWISLTHHPLGGGGYHRGKKICSTTRPLTVGGNGCEHESSSLESDPSSDSVWEAPARDGWPLRLPFLLLILSLAGLAASFLSSCGLGSSCPLLPRRFLLRTWLIVTNLACLKREDNRVWHVNNW
jgi:hypothetical protein